MGLNCIAKYMFLPVTPDIIEPPNPPTQPGANYDIPETEFETPESEQKSPDREIFPWEQEFIDLVLQDLYPYILNLQSEYDNLTWIKTATMIAEIQDLILSDDEETTDLAISTMKRQIEVIYTFGMTDRNLLSSGYDNSNPEKPVAMTAEISMQLDYALMLCQVHNVTGEIPIVNDLTADQILGNFMISLITNIVEEGGFNIEDITEQSTNLRQMKYILDHLVRTNPDLIARLKEDPKYGEMVDTIEAKATIARENEQLMKKYSWFNPQDLGGGPSDTIVELLGIKNRGGTVSDVSSYAFEAPIVLLHPDNSDPFAEDWIPNPIGGLPMQDENGNYIELELIPLSETIKKIQLGHPITIHEIDALLARIILMTMIPDRRLGEIDHRDNKTTFEHFWSKYKSDFLPEDRSSEERTGNSGFVVGPPYVGGK